MPLGAFWSLHLSSACCRESGSSVTVSPLRPGRRVLLRQVVPPGATAGSIITLISILIVRPHAAPDISVSVSRAEHDACRLPAFADSLPLTDEDSLVNDSKDR